MISIEEAFRPSSENLYSIYSLDLVVAAERVLRQQPIVWGRHDVPHMGTLVLSLDLANVPHHDVDESILDEAQEHEEGAGRHEYINSLKKIKSLFTGILNYRRHHLNFSINTSVNPRVSVQYNYQYIL